MKLQNHKKRKSFSTWAMPNQRIATDATQLLDIRRRKAVSAGRVDRNIGKNNGPVISQPARHRSTQFTLHKHSILSDPMGPKAKVIPSQLYAPQPKAPSHRDTHRMKVKEAAL